MTEEPLHTHLTVGPRPTGECPACDDVAAVFARRRVAAA